MSLTLVHSAPASTSHKDYANATNTDETETPLEHAENSTPTQTDTDPKSDTSDENKAIIQLSVSTPELDPPPHDLAQKPIGIEHPPGSAPIRRRRSISEILAPVTPPPTPAPSPALTHARSKSNFLSPENERIVFGCTDDSIVAKQQLITVCIHGDETCGLVALNELIDENYFNTLFSQEEYSRNRLVVLLGNPKGLMSGRRFIDVNLNRIFHAQTIKRKHGIVTSGLHGKMSGILVSTILRNAPPPETCYELTRIQKIAEAIEDCDEYIDIHSTSAKSYPFALPAVDERSEEFARTFCVDYVIEKLVKSVSGTSIGWAHALNKPAICFECGQHEDRKAIEAAKAVIRRFVSGKVLEKAKAVLSCSENEIVRKGFKYCLEGGPPSFEKVQYDDILATDEEQGEIRCRNLEGAYIIMPTANPIIGEEAWFWGDLRFIRDDNGNFIEQEQVSVPTSPEIRARLSELKTISQSESPAASEPVRPRVLARPLTVPSKA